MGLYAWNGHGLPLTGFDEDEAETLFPMLGMAVRVVNPRGAQHYLPLGDRRRPTATLKRLEIRETSASACDSVVRSATVSHMEIGVRDLRNRTAVVIDAVKAGERVTLTVHGEPVADIVPHGQRTRWLSGTGLREQLQQRSADSQLTDELDALAGQTLDQH